MRAFRARPDETHVARDDREQLRQFVQAGKPDEASAPAWCRSSTWIRWQRRCGALPDIGDKLMHTSLSRVGRLDGVGSRKAGLSDVE